MSYCCVCLILCVHLLVLLTNDIYGSLKRTNDRTVYILEAPREGPKKAGELPQIGPENRAMSVKSYVYSDENFDDDTRSERCYTRLPNGDINDNAPNLQDSGYYGSVCNSRE